MELQGLGTINLTHKGQAIQPGQRFLIEVINRDSGGKAQIRLGGQVIPALLEISVQPGEKFWAKVHKIDESGIILARDKSVGVDKAQTLDARRIGRLYIEFGQNKENTLSNLLRQVLSDGKSGSVAGDGKGAPMSGDGKGAPMSGDGKGAPVAGDGKGAPMSGDGKGVSMSGDGKGAPMSGDGKGAPVPSDVKSALFSSEVKIVQNGEGKSLNAVDSVRNESSDEKISFTGKEHIATFVSNTVPQWSSLGKDGFMQLFLLFRGLGLDYERRLKNLDPNEQEQIHDLRGELKKSLKGILLALLMGGDSDGDEKLASKLLERLTGQQILLQGGNFEAPFYIMEIPLQSEGELYNQTLAIKASRKGKKLDLNHCRLALRAETPTLGELGVEGWIYEAQLTLKVFSDNPEYLQSLVEENFDHTREIFNQMGMHLHPITVGSLKTAEEFQRFLKGELREGVDYQV